MAGSALLLAAVLLVGLGLVHSGLGERKLIGPLLAPGRRQGLLEKSAFARATLRFAWHLTSFAWCGFAAILVAVAQAETGARAIPLIVSATFLLTGAVTLFASRGRHLAWPVFLLIGGLCLVPLL